MVVTIHDLIMFLFPQTRGSSRARAYTRLVGRAARRADLILADSKNTKADVVRVLGIPADRVVVVPLACQDDFRPVEDEQRLEAVREKYGLSPDFIFYIGGLDWRKNLPLLLRAFASLGKTNQLAIAGRTLSSNPASFPDLPGLARELGIQDRVVFLGQVAEEDKPALYSAAAAFVFPSLYEGFGLTPLEAMACGVPVVCSRAGSLPEVVGDAALLFDPQGEGALARALGQVLTEDNLRERLRERGLSQARRFSWERTAAETLQAYQSVAPGRSLAEKGQSQVWGSAPLPDANTALRRALRELHGWEGRVLEVGCGAGRFIRRVKRELPGISAFGCDLDRRALALGQDYKDEVRYAAAAAEALPYQGEQFDGVLLLDVLEHLQDPRRGLAEIRRVLRPGGRLHALVPCEGQPGTLHWLTWRLGLAADLKERHSGHRQRFTQQGLRRLLAEEGFQIEWVSYSMHPLGQVKDLLTYLEREPWFQRWHLDNPLYRLLMKLLWAAGYVESNLLFKKVALGSVALHITARKVGQP
jgi:SAM-dependent methyltransferase